MIRTRLRKIGNSHGILLPSEVVRYWRAKRGTELELSFDADRLIVRPARGDREDVMKALGEILGEDDEILRALAR